MAGEGTGGAGHAGRAVVFCGARSAAGCCGGGAGLAAAAAGAFRAVGRVVGTSTTC